MANVTGGSTYGSYNSSSGYGGQGKYQGFSNQTYAASGTGGDVGGLGVYGDYTTGKSTLDKYKKQGTTASTSGTGYTSSANSSKPSITGTGGE